MHPAFFHLPGILQEKKNMQKKLPCYYAPGSWMSATKMNPHLEYGQAIPGVNTGRGIGIIETVALISIADAAGLFTTDRHHGRHPIIMHCNNGIQHF